MEVATSTVGLEQASAIGGGLQGPRPDQAYQQSSEQTTERSQRNPKHRARAIWIQSVPQPMTVLRPLTPADHDALVEVYRDAVLSQTQGLYSQAQIEAWAFHAARSTALHQPLREGFGLASLSEDQPTSAEPASDRQLEHIPIEAFGILHPPDRLALLYCRGRSSRQGRASAILRALEQRAAQQAVPQLRTEASQLSRPLLTRRGWQVEGEERVLFAGEWFLRWRMIKDLATHKPRDPLG